MQPAETSGSQTAALLTARGISKRFSGVPVLQNADLEVRRGEVHALVGGNGAGKSTLMHIIAGVLQPDEGQLTLEGQAVHFRDAGAAQRAGIGMVFQEGSLAAPLSVAENVFFARQPANRWGVIDRAALWQRTQRILEQLSVSIDPGTPVEQLSPAQRQLVEIAKALSLDARLFIFDEPTSALTNDETEHLFTVIRRLCAGGAGIIYISHRLAEIFGIADRVTVLRDGRIRGTVMVADSTPGELIALMSGRAIGGEARPAAVAADGTPMFQVQGLSDGTKIRDVSFAARAGEIVALAGLNGAGRTEAALTVFGARRRTAGRVLVDGREVYCDTPREAMRQGIGYLPEDRKETGLFLEMSVAANIASASLGSFGELWLNGGGMETAAAGFCRQLGVVSRGAGQRVSELSGGNQQKVALAKWLLRKPRVLIVDEPTRGVDVGAKGDVHRILRELAAAGAAVVLISSELREVLELADHVYVMHGGTIAGEMAREQASEELILRLATHPGGEDARAE